MTSRRCLKRALRGHLAARAFLAASVKIPFPAPSSVAGVREKLGELAPLVAVSLSA
jgi:hypothetical protein